jgi:porin
MRTTSLVIRQVSPARSIQAAALVLAGAAATAATADAATNEPPDTLTGSWSLRAKIEERGVTPFAVWTTEVWGNVAGGLQRHGWWNSLLDFGVELDTAKLGWWEGGSFMAQAHWVQNSRNDVCFDGFSGGFNPVSSVMAGDHLRIFNLHYRHAWRDEAVVLKLGQLAADDDFMGSDYSALFLNSAFGAMPSQVGTPLATSCGSPPAFPIFSVAAPGVFLRVQPVEPFYTQLGLYYGRPGFDERGNHGFDWASQSPAELGLFWESGFSYKIAQHPATARLGLSYHTGPLDDFSGSTSGEPPATRQNVPNFYLVHDFELLADGEGKTKLGLFVRGGVTPEPDRSMVAAYADAGLNWFAPWPGRVHDVAGLALSCTGFGDDFRRSSVSEGAAATETTLELTYKAQATRWMALQADAQFLFNPSTNPESGQRETAVVVGMGAEINF